jgi:nucleoid-associated protein YgaU
VGSQLILPFVRSKGGRSLLLAFALLFTFSATANVSAATSTAKPTAKATAKSTAKATAKPTAKATAKPAATAKATAKASPAASKKAPAKKKVVKKKPKKKKRISLTPAPAPVWPPKGFTVAEDVYAKVPTKLSEIIAVISTQPYLAKQVKNCDTYTCGYVQVASVSGCLWWEALSTIVAGDGRKLGDLKTAHGGSNPQEIRTFIIVSPEPVATGTKSVLTSVICHRNARDNKNPSTQYSKVETSTSNSN